MNEPEYSLAWPDGVVSGLPEHLWVGDDFLPDDYPPAEVTGGLTSLRFIIAAIRRRARLWCATAVVGIIAGCALSVVSPAPYQATTSLLLTPGPYENVNTVQNNDQAMAQSRTVASAALRKLGLTESPAQFLSSYTAMPLTDRVLQITISAPSADQAAARANAVATAFLAFRAGQMQAQQKLIIGSLDQQISQAQAKLASIDSRIAQGQDDGLRTQRGNEQALLYQLKQNATQSQVAIQPQIDASVKGSIVLDAALVLPHSSLKPLLRGVAIGLLAGLMLGIGYVVIAAIVSDRLRRRDDVARALGAPVKLSIRAAQGKWGLPRRGGPAVTDADVQRIAAYLRGVLPAPAQGASPGVSPGVSQGGVQRPDGLAVVPVDDTRIAARGLLSLAVSLARAGQHVVVADLCAGAPVATLLGAADPGVRVVSTEDTRLSVAVPGDDEFVPSGPFGPEPARRSAFAEAVAAACGSAGIVLTLVTLDPALGGEHLATWAADAVVVVTAGESSETRIRAVGELVRLSGTRLASAVLVGADKADESLGTVSVPEIA